MVHHDQCSSPDPARENPAVSTLENPERGEIAANLKHIWRGGRSYGAHGVNNSTVAEPQDAHTSCCESSGCETLDNRGGTGEALRQERCLIGWGCNGDFDFSRRVFVDLRTGTREARRTQLLVCTSHVRGSLEF